jgi:prepilin-type N-terminal cleavage/methylation domain-containing protein
VWRRAFTLVEVLVVMVIIAILAMLTVPRLMGMQGRQAEVEAQAIRALLSQAAQRDAVSSDTIALNFDSEKQELSVQSLSEKEGLRDWRPLSLIRPVRFSSIVLADAAADGQTQTPDTGFRVVFAGAQPRPAISLLIRTASDLPGTPRTWQADLLPGQTVATLRALNAEAPLSPPESASIDLDAAGQRTQPW